MNEYEIDDIVALFERDREEIPNLYAAALALSRLRGWTNSHSDGWCYWVKPSTAATQLITLVKDGERAYRKTWEWTDVTEAQLTKALTPVKSFLTRQGARWQLVLNPPPIPDPLRAIKAQVWEEGMTAAKLAAQGIKPAINPYLD